MNRKLILLVENDRGVAASVSDALRAGEFEVGVVLSGRDALASLGSRVPDVLLLATTLPDVVGLDLCRVLRSRPRTRALPIIVLSSGPNEKVRALESGADDVIPSPIDVEEVRARVHALLRRRPAPLPILEGHYAGTRITADFAAVAVQADGRPVSLTRREFLLLRAFTLHANQLLTREELLASVWSHTTRDLRVVDSAVSKLRTRLGDAGRQVETVHGFGYRFVEPPSASTKGERR